MREKDRKMRICVPCVSIEDVTSKEKKEVENLIGLMKKVYPMQFSQTEILPCNREPGYTSKFPSLHPKILTTYFPKGLDDCVKYLVGRFGKEQEVREYLSSC